MFQFLGGMIVRTWPAWLIAWVALIAWLHLAAPSWDKVTRDGEFGFLPEDTPTRQGERLLARAFPDDRQASNIVIVIRRADEELKAEDRAFIKNVVKPALMKLADEEGGLADQGPASESRPSIIAAIRTLDDPGSGVLLVSANRRATLVLVELTTELLEQRNWPILEKIETLITHWRSAGQAPAGLDFSLIGSATVGRDITLGQRQSAQATELWTIVIVIVILLLIYRAPFLAMIPLISVYMATQIALKLLSFLAQAGVVTLFEGIETYITVILYGTGVDYCLFLIARYQEEREQGASWGDALAQAIGRVGPALSASAATVMFGIGMMTFARFGKFHHAGIAIAFSLAVSVCVVLTFTTSLLRLAGPIAFWPRSIVSSGDASASAGGWLSWAGVSRALVRWPGWIWLIAVLVMSPLAVGGLMYADNVDYDFVRRLPADAPSVAGTQALQRDFPAGEAGTITVLIYQPDLDFLAEDGKGQIELSVLTDRLVEQQALLHLADIRSWSRPLGTGWVARQAAGASLKDINRGLKDALNYYTSHADGLKGHVTRMELTMHLDPMSREGIESLNHIEDAVRAELYGELRHAKLYFLGVTADMRALRQVTGGDQTRIQILVASCVLLILVILLRRGLVSLYLIASVLFSYFATLGAAVWFFWQLDPGNFVGLDWKVPLFLFTILVAIGEDYNIFLITRITEEQARHGPIEGIRVALAKTGRIITSCGIIMAGTFASLMAGTMQDLHHLGFALAFGVLVDTFIVRPILVPAFLIILERVKLLWQNMSTVLARSADDNQARKPPVR